jgi:hypothetical protein
MIIKNATTGLSRMRPATDETAAHMQRVPIETPPRQLVREANCQHEGKPSIDAAEGARFGPSPAERPTRGTLAFPPDAGSDFDRRPGSELDRRFPDRLGAGARIAGWGNQSSGLDARPARCSARRERGSNAAPLAPRPLTGVRGSEVRGPLAALRLSWAHLACTAGKTPPQFLAYFD